MYEINIYALEIYDQEHVHPCLLNKKDLQKVNLF